MDPMNTITDGSSEEKSSYQKSKDSKTRDPSASSGDNSIIFPKGLKNQNVNLALQKTVI